MTQFLNGKYLWLIFMNHPKLRNTTAALATNAVRFKMVFSLKVVEKLRQAL